MHNSPTVLSWPRLALATIGVGTGLLASPLTARDDQDATRQAAEAGPTQSGPSQAPRERRVLDLMITVPRNESDQLLEQDCEEEADAARIANEIVVCRQLGEASDGSWNKEEFERGYAERSQGEKPVNTFGIADLAHSISIGSAPEPVLIIDVEGLPQAPVGSDADRIAKGLPPLGQDEDLAPEEIQRRRRAAGLDSPDLPIP